MGEFEVIREIIKNHDFKREDVWLGPGDDCAGVAASGQDLVMSIDTLVEAVHFESDMPALSLGHKAMAVSLSDIAAMGARPQWALCTLTMPEYHQDWLTDFSQGLHQCCEQFDVQCIGGDLSVGPLSVTTQVTGALMQRPGLMRSRAKIGDDIYVSGDLGRAAFAYQHLQHSTDDLSQEQAAVYGVCLAKLHRPTPKISLGLRLVASAHAAIDISDGLIGDLRHICAASAVGAVLNPMAIPVAAPLYQAGLSELAALQMAVTSGDEYELLFTAPRGARQDLLTLSADLGQEITKIGEVVAGSEISWQEDAASTLGLDQLLALKMDGWQHF